MPRRLLLILPLLLIFSTQAISQSEPWPKTLLWRITGNGLAKPSYLFGTMHVQDKRAFRFTDSVYRAIESVDGLALEVDFKEMVDSLMNKMMDEEDEEDEYDEEEIKNWNVDSVLKTISVDKRSYNPVTLKRIRQIRIRKLATHGEMPTIVDGYLFGLALRHGKWTGGIEDVSDQLNLVDEFGENISPDKAFEPEAKLRTSLEEMIRIYADNDLQGIDNYIETRFDRKFRNSLLVNRNLKMARRMDSLSKWRTMFFAVGAAHLPGDSGVINLLRRAGYKVDPVFSPTSTNAESYSGRLAALPWKEVNEDEFYSIKMPGSPSDFDRFGESVKMKVFFDLPTMTYYMAGHTIRNDQGYSELSNTFRELMKNMGARGGKPKLKDVSGNGMVGVEGGFDIPAGSYTVRLLQKKKIMYILMMGTSKRSNFNQADLNKFFTSFVAKEGDAANFRLKTFTIPGKNFSLQLPGKPKPNKDVDKDSEASSWIFKTFDLADRENGLYYMVQVRDMKPGYYLEGDTTYFNVATSEMTGAFRIIRKEYTTYQGWNAMNLEFADEGELLYKMFAVVRGNRVYTLFGGGQKNYPKQIDTVFASFRLLEAPAATNWSRKEGKGFTTSAPGHFIEQKPDEGDEDMVHFVSYDTSDAVSYEVLISKLSDFYWSASDSAFFTARKEKNTNYTDSVINYQTVWLGKLKGVEYVIQKSGSNAVKKIREFVSGDSVYTVVAFFPETYLKDARINSFYADFTITDPKPPLIYTTKVKELMAALRTKDELEFEKASEVLDAVTFTREDLPYLHEALMHEYSFEHSYSTVNSYITDALEGLADSTTVEFIAKNYGRLNGGAEHLKFDLLAVLGEMKTKESYSLLKDLALNHPPLQGNDIGLGFAIFDSLELARSLYPDLLKLTVHSGFADINALVTTVLFDSGLLTKEQLIPYRDLILTQGAYKLDSVLMDSEYYWRYTDWPSFIGLFNDEKSNAILFEFLEVDEMDIKLEATVALANNNQPVPKKVLETLAGDLLYRGSLYFRLRQANLLHVFPEKFATQQKLAESEIYEIAGEDDDYPSSVTFIGEKTGEYNKKTGKFYLFRIGWGEGNDAEYYLGITGPYPPDSKTILDETEASGIYFEEEYEKAKLERLFRLYLEEFQKEILKKD